MKLYSIAALFLSAFFIVSTGIAKPQNKKANKTIQVALILDTSGSMDGLINQAKERLWGVVNTLSSLRDNSGNYPEVEIALYEYGNTTIPTEPWVRQLNGFTQDLDAVSAKLFALHTNGGEEYCGAALQHALQSLEWSNAPEAMRMIFIAGNEPFNQGNISYQQVIKQARNRDIYINTIFCGDRTQGISTLWQDGAFLGKGEYFSIQSNNKVQHIATPYDQPIAEANAQLNATYMAYNQVGETKKLQQKQQDIQYEALSSSSLAERVVSKSRSNAYNNAHWDLIDKIEEDATFLEEVEIEDLPENLDISSREELKTLVKEQQEKRKEIQKNIEQLNQQRMAFIEQEKSKQPAVSNDLGTVMDMSIRKQAAQMGYM